MRARIAEIRALIDTPALAQAGGVTAEPGSISTNAVYESWAPRYDGPNTMIDIEQPAVRRLLGGLPVGTALDAACGTGRHAAHLAGLGHRVVGIDASSAMLAHARRRLPEVEFREADLRRIPLADDAVDTIVCGLALTHVPDVAPVMAEFARVLRAGGHLVISDAHLLWSYLRPTLARPAGEDRRPAVLTEYHRPLSEYPVAALPFGFQVRHCEEPCGAPVFRTPTDPVPDPLPTHVSWELMGWCPGAAAAALDNAPRVVVLHFQLDGVAPVNAAP